MFRCLYLVVIIVLWAWPARADYYDGLRAYDADDYATAAEEWQAAADQGDKDSQFRLGQLYEQGVGVVQSFVTTHSWYNLATAQGHKEARQARDVIAGKMTSEQFAQAQELAARRQPQQRQTAEELKTSSSEQNRVTKGASANESEASEVESGKPPKKFVTEVQRRLGALGYDPDPADGVIGRHTTAAIKAYQRSAGLEADGVITPDLVRRLRNEPLDLSQSETSKKASSKKSFAAEKEDIIRQVELAGEYLQTLIVQERGVGLESSEIVDAKRVLYAVLSTLIQHHVDPINYNDFAQIVRQGMEIQLQRAPTVNASKLLASAINYFIDAVDPNSSYLDSKSFQTMRGAKPTAENKDERTWLGIQVTKIEGQLVIISPIYFSTADRNGLQPRDMVTEINQTPTNQLTLEESRERLAGAIGQLVTLKIQRPDGNQVEELTLKLEKFGAGPVYVWSEDSTLFVRISSFSSQSSHEFETRVKKMLAQNDVTKIVLDLRNNPGGLVSEAIRIADLLLDKGLIVSMRGSGVGSEKQTAFQAEDGDILHGLPLLILINDGTAQMAEVLAAALQDNKRARVFGTRSFGMASIISIIPIDNMGALRTITGRYFRPSGTTFDRGGVRPDIVLTDLGMNAQEYLRIGKPLRKDPFLRAAARLLATDIDARTDIGKATAGGTSQKEAVDEPVIPPTRFVEEVQRRLAALGYDPGPVDGTIGQRTTVAVEAYQRKAGLERDGLITPNLVKQLRKEKPSASASQSSSSEAGYAASQFAGNWAPKGKCPLPAGRAWIISSDYTKYGQTVSVQGNLLIVYDRIARSKEAGQPYTLPIYHADGSKTERIVRTGDPFRVEYKIVDLDTLAFHRKVYDFGHQVIGDDTSFYTRCGPDGPIMSKRNKSLGVENGQPTQQYGSSGQLLGQFRDWSSAKGQGNHYAATPAKAGGEGWLTVNLMPTGKTEVSVTSEAIVGGANLVRLIIGDRSFRFFTDGSTAWAIQDSDDAAILSAIMAGTQAIATSAKGKLTFSLFGASKAIAAIEEESGLTAARAPTYSSNAQGTGGSTSKSSASPVSTAQASGRFDATQCVVLRLSETEGDNLCGEGGSYGSTAPYKECFLQIANECSFTIELIFFVPYESWNGGNAWMAGRLNVPSGMQAPERIDVTPVGRFTGAACSGDGKACDECYRAAYSEAGGANADPNPVAASRPDVCPAGGLSPLKTIRQ